MGIVSTLIGGGANNLISGVADAVDRFVETPDEKAAQNLKLQAMALKPMMEQIEVNKIEASHKSIFVAGGRPFTIWLCGFCMAGIIFAGVYGWLTGLDITPLYALYGSTVAPVHLGLLGLRTYEKAKAVATHSMSKKT